MIDRAYDIVRWLLSEYDWSSSEQTKEEFIKELKQRIKDSENHQS